MIDRDRFDKYDRAVAAGVALLDAAVSEVCRAAEGLSGEELRQALSEAYPALVGRYGSAIAEAACEFYADIRAGTPSLPAYEPQAFSPSQDGLLAWDVSRALAASDAASALVASARQRAMAYADETVVRNSQRDPAHPKWAIVPHAGACPWCVMLGSNGFQYRSRGSAGASRHPSCTCSVVADFDTANPSLDGYKPGAMRDAWQSCRDAVEADARAKWAAMGPEERKKYSRRGSPSFDAYLRNRVVEEMGTRDRGWLQTGMAVKTDYSLNPLESYGRLKRPGDYSPENIVDRGNEWRDLWAHHVLEAHGYKVATRPAAALDAQGRVMDGVTCPDLFVGDEIWEVKSPPPRTAAVKPGNELKFINAQMRSADKNFRNPYDVELKAPMPSKPPTRVILNVRYMGNGIDIFSDAFASKLMAEMKQFDVCEVMAIDADGKIARYKKST